MKALNHLVIMAGGVGSRFWPMSTPECPKQFIDVLGCGKTLLQLTVDRFRGVCLPENVWVVTSKRYLDIVKSQLPDIPESNILLEPCMRNTAPCVAYVSWKIKKKCPNANIVVTASDHLVMDVEEFKRVICGALEFTMNSNAILTLGMKPSRPETGYGYIEADLDKPALSDKEIFSVKAFKEKPNLATACEYIKSSAFFWNSGIFIWNVETIMNAIKLYQPEIAVIFEKLSDSFFTNQEQEMIDRYFPECNNISIDYAVLEKADEIYVFPSNFGWSDLGTWGSLQEQLERDSQQNACVGSEIKMFESSNCIVHTPQKRKVVIQGLDGYIIAEKNNALLICKLDQEQRIKEFSK